MSGLQTRIDIYVPTVSRFPELCVPCGYREPAHMMLPPMDENNKSEPSAVAEVAAAALEEENDVQGSGRSLFITDCKGRLLEHVRYQGTDYRSALRAAFNITPSNWRQ